MDTRFVWIPNLELRYMTSILQAISELIRDIYLKSSKELELETVYPLKIIRPLYGLSDSLDNWNILLSALISQMIYTWKGKKMI